MRTARHDRSRSRRTLSRGARAALLALACLLAAPAVVSAACTAPRQLGLSVMVDDSGSMADTDPDKIRESAIGLAVDQLPNGTSLATGSFDESGRTFTGPAGLTSANRAKFKADPYFDPSNSTDFDEGFGESLAHLNAMPRTADRRAVVFVTDGDSTYSYSNDDAIAAKGVPIYTVGIGVSTSNAASLRAIAQGSGRGGKYYDVADAAELQSAIAEITNSLLCRAPRASTSASLAPGETAEFPFDVPAGGKGWRGVVSWGEGRFDVEAVRPDGSVMNASNKLLGETYDATSPVRRQLMALQPRAGQWKMRVRNTASGGGKADVYIDVFESPTGQARVAFDTGERELLTLPRQPEAANPLLGTLRGVPLHLYVSVYGRASGTLTPGAQAGFEQTGPDSGLVLTVPAGRKVLDFGNLRWKEGSAPPRTSLVGPDLTGQTTSIALLDATNPLKQRVVLTLGRILEGRYREDQLVGNVGLTADVVGGARLNLSGYTAEVVPWASARLVAVLGSGAATLPAGGAGAAAASTALVSQTQVAWAAEALAVANEAKTRYDQVLDAVALVKFAAQRFPPVIEALLPQIRNQMTALGKQVVDAVNAAFARAVDRVRIPRPRIIAGKSTSRAASTTTAAAPFTAAGKLRAERPRSARRLRPLRIPKKRAGTAATRLNRYAQGSRVRMRALLVSGRRAKGRRIVIASRVAKRRKVKGQVAIATLLAPDGTAYERAVRVSRRTAAARITLPKRMAKGRWLVALTDYGATRRSPKGIVEMAAAEIRIR